MNRKNLLIGLSITVFFSILYVFGVLAPLGDSVYDIFLRFRANRERSQEIVFLDVDDSAIENIGVFPWPRSIIADALLRLREFGARAAIFDIELTEKGHQGVDEIYLRYVFPTDFDSTRDEINTLLFELSEYTTSDYATLEDVGGHLNDLRGIIADELKNEQMQTGLFYRTQRIARDNDKYFELSSQLFGRSWSALRLTETAITESDDQMERRSIAEEQLSYSVTAHTSANNGRYIDILPALPGFSRAAQGAGFVNVEIDRDGTRRRVDLAQNIHDHWYLQLAFSPLVNYLGRPELELSSQRMILRNAQMPGGIVKDISIPLDGNGRMLLDWPKEDYLNSYEHITFYDFFHLEELEGQLEGSCRELYAFEGNIYFFSQFDDALQRLTWRLSDILDRFDEIREYKDAALEYNYEEYFEIYVEKRKEVLALIRDIINIDLPARMDIIVPYSIELLPELADIIYSESDRIISNAQSLKLNLDRYELVSDIVENTVRDKFCILGYIASETTDIGANPFHSKYINVGTHGVVLDMILSEVFIYPVSMIWRVLFAVVFVSLFFLITGEMSPVPRVVSGFVTIFLFIALAAALFRFTGIFFNPLLVLISMIGSVILREIIAYAGSEREKQFIRKAFSTYVSHDVVKEIIADPTRLQLGGTKRYMTTVFTDLKGFSTISEGLDPEDLVNLLNRYLTNMSDAILEEKGTIDKYIGDAIVAFFGAPIPISDHAVRACKSAIYMKRIENALNRKIIEEKLSPTPLLTRIGINTGDMVAGNMGTENKMNYTIMGNAVNLAARLEGANKQYGTWILASESTVNDAQEYILARKLDRIRVVGINEPVRIYELLDLMESVDPEKEKLAGIFNQAMDYYENRKWKEAIQGFEESLSIENGGPSEIYLKRSKTYMAYPPPEEWDGVHNLTEK